MNPEDRLRDALSDRAASARTSPHALDGVFGKVARHRRNVRLAAAGGAALSVVAVSLVASAALRTDASHVTPVAPTPAVTPVPSEAPSATPTAAPTTPPPPPTDRAIVALADRRVVEISTVTGAQVRVLGTLPVATTSNNLAWSEDRERVYYAGGGCSTGELDVATGGTRRVANGLLPALSPDGSRVATVACGERYGVKDVLVTDLRTGTATTFERFPEGHMENRAEVTDLAWADDGRLLVVRKFQGGLRLLEVDVRTDDGLEDARMVEISPRLVADRDGDLVGVYEYLKTLDPSEEPEYLATVPLDGKPRQDLVRLTSFPAFAATSIALAGDGSALFVTKDGVWRWRTGDRAPVLIRRGAVAVAT